MALIASWHRERDVISECFVIGSPNVGPGTYDPRLPAAKTCTLGIGDRPNPSRDASDLPGPGQYAVRRLATDPVPDRPSQSLTASCSSFNSTTSRCDPENVREPTFVPGSNWFVASSILDNPGPGQSNPRDAVDRRSKTGGVYERSRPGKADWGAERAVQAMKEGTRLHTQTEPAIKPLRDRSDWNFTGEPGDTPDPYSMQSLEIGRGKRKVHFAAPSERKATWGNPHLKRNPGPGTYEHEPVKVDLPLRLPGGTGGGGPPMEPPGFGSDVPHCSTTFASSKVPTAFFPKSFSPAMLPGPATYFAEPAPKSSPDRPLPAFRSVSARFAERDSGASPGPGHYPSLSDFPDDRIRRARSVPDFMNRKFFGVQNPYQLKSLRETDGASLAGFGSRSPQRPVTVSKSAAAPGSYDPESSIGQSISAKLRQLAKIAQGGAFGGSRTGERFLQGPGTSGDNAMSMSAPSLPQADPVKDAGDAARGSFKSEAPRLPAPANEELPGPGAYDPITNPDFRAGWRIAKTDHVGFGGSGARFASGETDVPPPGSYEMAHESIRGGYHPFRSTEARGLPMPKVAPKGLDPGCYDVARSLIRKTFNTKVEEHALLLQTPSDKRPPPRGPFPWAEGSSWKPKQALERAALEDAPPQAG